MLESFDALRSNGNRFFCSKATYRVEKKKLEKYCLHQSQSLGVHKVG